MSTPNLRILICDDHELIRGGLRRVLANTGAAHTIGEASNAAEASEAIQREKWDLVILDINLGGRSGLEVMQEIAAEFPHLPTLILSGYPEDQFALRTIRAGARGYLNKNTSAEILIEAVRRVASGGHYFSQEVAEQLLNVVQHPETPPPHHILSTREDQVLRMIGSGHTVGEIAAQLALSVKTVSTYRSIVLRKLDLRNNAQIMRYALQHGIVE